MKKTVATNKKAFHDYFIIEQYDAGMVLSGKEVRSLREGRATLKDSYIRFHKGEAFVVNLHISHYSHASDIEKYNPERARKILLHKTELKRLMGKVKEKGFSAVPLEVFFSKTGYAKIKIGLVKGKKLYDKRESIKMRDIERETQRELS